MQQHALGLVTFASDVRVDCDITPLFEDFRDKVKNIQERGDTKLWDAIGKAAEMLEQYSKAEAERRTKRKIGAGLPPMSLRIVVLSDGADTKSTEFSDQPKLLQKLQNARITVDSIQIGSETSRDLLALCVGNHFAPPLPHQPAAAPVQHTVAVGADGRLPCF